ncbi:MAG TPA: formyltransferase family protein [Bacteroidia bacterium]|jgi:hypothetical protein|nr:formyltransferase family protein [Bacteroidia bacterium]
MRIVFIGRDNVFNRRIIKELSTQHEIAGSFFVEPQRGTTLGKLKKIQCRAKKYGTFKLIDEVLFHCFDRMILRNKEFEFYKARPEYSTEIAMTYSPEYIAENIHEEKQLEIIRQIKPDIIFSVCCSVIFKKQLYQIPSLGTYVLHEGVTPEYRGLHNNLWAIMKKEYQFIGYTVLKAGNEIDGGEILVQGKYNLGENENFRTWGWVGHNAIIEGMENIKMALKQLEQNSFFIPVENKNRESNYYTWMGISDFTILYLKNYTAKYSKMLYNSLAMFRQRLF